MSRKEKEENKVELLLPNWVNRHCSHLETYTVFGKTYKNDKKEVCCCTFCKFRYRCVRGCAICAIEFKSDRAYPLKEEECEGFEDISQFLKDKELLNNPAALCDNLYPHHEWIPSYYLWA